MNKINKFKEQADKVVQQLDDVIANPKSLSGEDRLEVVKKAEELANYMNEKIAQLEKSALQES